MSQTLSIGWCSTAVTFKLFIYGHALSASHAAGLPPGPVPARDRTASNEPTAVGIVWGPSNGEPTAVGIERRTDGGRPCSCGRLGMAADSGPGMKPHGRRPLCFLSFLSPEAFRT